MSAYLNYVKDEPTRPSYAKKGNPVAGNVRGFTLLEVLVALVVLAVGVAITMSLITGALGKIWKVQARTGIIEQAQSVMELTLLDDTIRGPVALTGAFDDGVSWRVTVEEYVPPDQSAFDNRIPPRDMPVKLLHYTVDIFRPDSGTADYRLQTIKLVSASEAVSQSGAVP
ncbi:MAG TPA: prepilin-type N-terminal cleavage/methylation domain-containing protein [Acidobacteriota bacterium]|nr:prepilin-type N-terminal cleavage/methylation domain-containing protein [Acidobacteriota bacterium]